MKKVLCLCILFVMAFMTSCVGVQSSIPTSTPNENSDVNNGAISYIYVEYLYWQHNESGYECVTQKAPIIAVNSLGKYLVDIDFSTQFTDELKNEWISRYLTDISPEDYAEDFVYDMLKKDESRHALLYVTQEQYQDIIGWSLNVTKIIDLTQTDDYKQNGYLKLESNKIPYEEVFG